MSTRTLSPPFRQPAGPGRLDADSGVLTHPVLLSLTLVTLMLPVSISIGTYLISPSRLVFLITLPILFVGLIAGRFGKFTLIDGLFISFVAWRTMTPFITNPSRALEFTGSNLLIILGAYLVARATVRNSSDFLFAARILVLFALVTFPLALYESITGNMVLPKFLEMIPGVQSVADANYDRRLGLDRAQVIFPHPILYGLFCSVCFSLAFTGLKNHLTFAGRWVKSTIVLGCCFLSVSSGPLLSAMVQTALIGWSIVFRKYDWRWKVLLSLSAVGYVILEIASNRPAIFAIVTRLSFSSGTANVRRVLFEYGVVQIQKTPIFGVGFNNWGLPSWMTGSLDNYWLALALQFGLPTLTFAATAFVIAMIRVGRRRFTPGTDLWNLQLAWIVTMVSISLTLATVYVWNEVASIIFFLFGAGQFLIFVQERDASKEPPLLDTQRRGVSYTRFARRSPPPSEPAPEPQRRKAGTSDFQGEFR